MKNDTCENVIMMRVSDKTRHYKRKQNFSSMFAVGFDCKTIKIDTTVDDEV